VSNSHRQFAFCAALTLAVFSASACRHNRAKSDDAKNDDAKSDDSKSNDRDANKVAHGQIVLLRATNLVDTEGSKEPAQLFRQALHTELTAAAFTVITDEHAVHDFEVSVSGTVDSSRKLFRSKAKAVLTVTRHGAAITDVDSSTSLVLSMSDCMGRLAKDLVESLFDADQFTDVLQATPARAQVASASKATRVEQAKTASVEPKPEVTEEVPEDPPVKPLKLTPGVARLVAVLPLNIRAKAMDDTTRETLEEAVRTVAGDALAQYGYTVLTGENTLQLLTDNGVDPTKTCDSSCGLEAARELKAQLFLSGSVTREGKGYVVFIRLFSQERGQQIASVQIEGDTPRDLRHSFSAQAPAFFKHALAMSGQ
jgi:hypothetical protein